MNNAPFLDTANGLSEAGVFRIEAKYKKKEKN